MQALIFHEPHNLALGDVPAPVVSSDTQVLIRVEATGICGTDIHIASGNYPATAGVILGHETTGVVVATGAAVQGFGPGDRVILDPTYHCGVCSYCRSDRPNYCAEKARTETGVSSPGTFADYHVAEQAFLHPLPGELSFAEGTLTEPLACCLHALRQVRHRTDTRALVVGAGPMGLLFAITLRAMGLDVITGDIQPYRLEQARAIMHGDHTVHDLGGDGLDRCRDGARFDLVVDTSGCMLERLLPRVERGGDLLLAGLDYNHEARIRPSYLTDNGIRLVGSIDTDRTFARAIDLLRRVPDYRRIITHSLPLRDHARAFELLGVTTGKRGAIQANKIVLQSGAG